MHIKKQDLEKFLAQIYSVYGDDFTEYKTNTLKRRITTHSISLGVDSFDEYTKLILSDKKHFNRMFEYFSINVTEFFREPKHLKTFREQMLEYLKTFSHIKIWYAGCSTGETVYSLAIVLEEMGLLAKTQIYATDFNSKVLAKAKEALYDFSDINKISENYKQSGGEYNYEKYFIKQGKYLQIKKYIKEHIVFFNHNLVTDGVMNEFNLVICKNVIIYFNQKLKKRVLKLFTNSLKTRGFLILGENEFLDKACEKSYDRYITNSKIYQKLLQEGEKATCK